MVSSSTDPSTDPLAPPNPLRSRNEDKLQAVIQSLNLQPHVEGGYFVETDRDRLTVPCPFSGSQPGETRSASTTIFYLLTPTSPLGAFHRNRGRTVHTLHRGRGRYVLVHADEVAGPRYPTGYGEDATPESDRWIGRARVETFVVGQDVSKGERLQWIVDGGKYKCSFLLPDEDAGDSSEGLLFSETVVPGFEFADHDFMKPDRMDALVTAGQRRDFDWMLRKS